MRRQEYHFPSPRSERLTQVGVSGDASILMGLLEVDRSRISTLVSYQRSLPKKIKLGEGPGERQPLIIEHKPEICEEQILIPQERTEEETEKSKSVTELVPGKRDAKVKEVKPSSLLVEKSEEPLNTLPSYDRISVVMAFRGEGGGRLEGLKKCIKNLREQTIDCYIILIEQDDVPANQVELEPLVDSYLFIYSDVMFNKSWAFNCGVLIAPDDLILLHDCDLLVPRNYVKESIRILGTKDMALPWAKILYLTEESSQSYPSGKPKFNCVFNNSQAVGGSILVRKDFYLRIGGMDERFEGWGGEDNAFYAKSLKLGRVTRANQVTGMVLLHHYHKPAIKLHTHNHINNHILWQYYQGSREDIMLKVRGLDPIGDPLKVVKKKENRDEQPTEVSLVNVTGL